MNRSYCSIIHWRSYDFLKHPSYHNRPGLRVWMSRSAHPFTTLTATGEWKERSINSRNRSVLSSLLKDTKFNRLRIQTTAHVPGITLPLGDFSQQQGGSTQCSMVRLNTGLFWSFFRFPSPGRSQHIVPDCNKIPRRLLPQRIYSPCLLLKLKKKTWQKHWKRKRNVLWWRFQYKMLMLVIGEPSKITSSRYSSCCFRISKERQSAPLKVVTCAANRKAMPRHQVWSQCNTFVG